MTNISAANCWLIVSDHTFGRTLHRTHWTGSQVTK